MTSQTLHKALAFVLVFLGADLSYVAAHTEVVAPNKIITRTYPMPFHPVALASDERRTRRSNSLQLGY